jgi:hypothetical protein
VGGKAEGAALDAALRGYGDMFGRERRVLTYIGP